MFMTVWSEGSFSTAQQVPRLGCFIVLDWDWAMRLSGTTHHGQGNAMLWLAKPECHAPTPSKVEGEWIPTTPSLTVEKAGLPDVNWGSFPWKETWWHRRHRWQKQSLSIHPTSRASDQHLQCLPASERPCLTIWTCWVLIDTRQTKPPMIQASKSSFWWEQSSVPSKISSSHNPKNLEFLFYFTFYFFLCFLLVSCSFFSAMFYSDIFYLPILMISLSSLFLPGTPVSGSLFLSHALSLYYQHLFIEQSGSAYSYITAETKMYWLVTPSRMFTTSLPERTFHSWRSLL